MSSFGSSLVLYFSFSCVTSFVSSSFSFMSLFFLPLLFIVGFFTALCHKLFLLSFYLSFFLLFFLNHCYFFFWYQFLSFPFLFFCFLSFSFNCSVFSLVSFISFLYCSFTFFSQILSFLLVFFLLLSSAFCFQFFKFYDHLGAYDNFGIFQPTFCIHRCQSLFLRPPFLPRCRLQMHSFHSRLFP
jgi:hypothetical protein